MPKITHICPMCNKQISLKISKGDFEKLEMRTNEHIQDLFPNFDKFQREFLISHYCPKCQMLIFASDYKITSIWEIK